MVTTLDTEKTEKINTVSPSNSKPYVLGKYNIDPKESMLILSNVELGEVPQKALDIVGKILSIARDELTLNKAEYLNQTKLKTNKIKNNPVLNNQRKNWLN